MEQQCHRWRPHLAEFAHEVERQVAHARQDRGGALAQERARPNRKHGKGHHHSQQYAYQDAQRQLQALHVVLVRNPEACTGNAFQSKLTFSENMLPMQSK